MEVRGVEDPRSDLFKPFVGHLVRCVFRDGEEIKAKKGKLVQAEGGFIVLRTWQHSYLIHVSQVLKISDIPEGRGEP
jgi:hypothetical protein